MLCTAGCGRETSNPKYCSSSCAAKHLNHLRPKRRPKERTCPRCGKTYFRGGGARANCLECNRRRMDPSLRTLSDMDFPANNTRRHWRWSWVRAMARRTHAAELRRGCEVCGYSIHVEIAHIKAVASFPPEATLAEVNARSNVRFLCPNHHWEFDNLPRHRLDSNQRTSISETDVHSNGGGIAA